MTHTQIRLPLSALFLAVASLAGCGGDSDAPPGFAKTSQTITFTQPAAVTVGGGTSTLVATSTSSLVVAFASTTQSICTVSGTTLTPVAAGTCHIEASQAGNGTYDAATTVAQDITVNPAAPVSGNTGTCTTAPCVDFAAVGVGLDAFGSSVTGAVVDDPVDATNKVGRIFKTTTSDTWGGATIYTTLADFSVTPIDLTTTKIITLRVYSPAAGQLIMLKVENLAGTEKLEAQATTTVANAWETLTFNYTTPTGGVAFNPAAIYNKVSVFPMFLLPLSADSTYYFDELKYTASSVVAPLTPLTFASGYKDVPGIAIRSNEDGDVGEFNDGTKTWGVDYGVAPPSAGVSNWYTGLGFAPVKDGTYFGAFVKGPANGTVNAAGYTSVNIKLWGNSELFNLQPNIKMVLQGPPVSGCSSNSGGAEIVATFKADKGVVDTAASYAVPISSFTVQAACGSGTTVQTILAAIAQVNYVLDVNNINYTTPTGGPWANYLNIGSIIFN
ncbi:MAG: hypothetical protein B7Y51_09515 [Burkholderiales bacterium 28-67-8]|nr:MAG: hypothetical protein B7Y51_09515 [Burkholderiales bacterium 28-67-8]